MRIARLELIRYGPFTDRALDIPDAPLVVIHGPNEAGKSSALAALGDLLFGFGHKTAQAFRHAERDLLLGAVLIRGDGATLSVRRRKGRARTLSDPEGAPLEDAALAGCLGGCDRALFEALFGLDARRLRKGGAALIRDGGDLGESLLSAGAALRDAAALRRALEAEAGALFSPVRSKNRAFYPALDRHEAARKALAASVVTRRAVTEAETRCTRADAALTQARAALEALDAEARRDARLRAAAPILARLDALRAERAALADLDAAAPGAAERLSQARDLAVRAQAQAQEARAREAEIAARRDAAAAPSPALARQAEIAALSERAGAVADALEALPALRAERAAETAALDDIARRLGLAPCDLAARAPTDPQIAAARAALEEGRALQASLDACARRLEQARLALETTPQAPDGADPAPMRATLERLRDAPERAEEAARAARAADRAARAAQAALDALDPQIADLAALRPPPAERLDAAEAEFAALARAQDALTARREAAARARATARGSARAAGEADAPPDRAALEAARSRRDAAWRALRRVRLEGGTGDAPGPDAFETLIAEADRIADRRETGAERLAASAASRAALAQCDADEAALEDEGRALAERRDAAQAQWAALWPPHARPPRPPAAMRAWLGERARALELALAAEEAAAQAAARAARAQAARDDLAALAATLGIATERAATLSCAGLVEAVEAALERRRQVWAARKARDEAEARCAATAAEHEAAHAALTAWRAAWAAHAAPLAMSPEAGVEAAEAALTLWSAAPGHRRALAGHEARIAGLEALIADATASADALRDAIDPDAAVITDPVAALGRIRVWRDRAQEDARRAEARAALNRSAQDQAQARATAERAAEAAEGRLRAEATRAGLDPDGPLDPPIERLRARDRLEAALGDAATQLAEQARGAPEQALRAALTGADIAAIEARMGAREAQLSQARAAVEDAAATAAQARAARDLLLESDGGAAQAAQAQGDAAAEIARIGRDWLTLRAASLLLGAATRRYRDANRDPVLGRAAELFRGLTCGAFSDLVVGLDENDAETLSAVRADGARVPPNGLSEGAADQLFLALRLAAIAGRAAEVECPPFIADDLFASFDDARAKAGLETLAAGGAGVQALVFTHHDAVAEAAAGLEGAAVLSL